MVHTPYMCYLGCLASTTDAFEGGWMVGGVHYSMNLACQKWCGCVSPYYVGPTVNSLRASTTLSLSLSLTHTHTHTHAHSHASLDLFRNVN